MSRPRKRMLLAVVAGTGITVCGCAAAPTPQMNPAGPAPAPTTTVGVASATEPPIGPAPGAQTPTPVGASGFPMPPPGTCHTGTFNGQPLPDPVCTPGSTNPAVTQANIHDTICRAGWTATVRPPVTVTDKIKAASARAYGLGADARGELDHEIPLELGGDPGSLTDVANLASRPHRSGVTCPCSSPPMRGASYDVTGFPSYTTLLDSTRRGLVAAHYALLHGQPDPSSVV